MRRVRSRYRPAATWAAPALPAGSASFGAVPAVWSPGLMITAIAILAVWYLAKH